jgi:G:T-mismatch repair DNA endonuclease (very short patch repair protein)
MSARAGRPGHAGTWSGRAAASSCSSTAVFWHACLTCGHQPTANAAWWAEKLAANVARDRRTDALLAALGWRVLRFWEHEDPDTVVDRICAELSRTDLASARSFDGGR